MDMKEIRKQNLKAVMTALFGAGRGVQKKMADLIDVQPDYISRCLADSSKKGAKNIGEDMVEKIENKLGLNRHEFDDPNFPAKMSGRLAGLGFQVQEEAGVYNVALDLSTSDSLTYPPPAPQAKLAPVISWVQAGEWGEAIDVFHPGDADKWEPVPDKTGEHAFWLKVVGDSMTAPTGISVPEGYLILVDPDVPADNGSLVVAKLTDNNEVTFKKLVLDAGQTYLKPLNPNYSTIQINGNCRIVGVVKKITCDL